jgi:NitT/TauT family transport system substrate-binding protein
LSAFRGVLVCLFLLVCAGCRSASEGSDAGAPAAAARVTLALNWVAEPEFGGFYAAREKGIYAREGLDVDILGGGPGAPVVQMVASGRAQFGISGADEIITAKARGVDIVALFAIYQTSPQAIMAHPGRGNTLADVFSSGTLAVEPGAAYSLFLKKKFGFDKVKVVPYDGGVARFLTDKDYAQQCFITSEPLAAKKQGVEPTVFLIADAGYNPYVGVVIARRSMWTDERDRVTRFVRASREGWRAYQDDPGPANAVMSKLNTAMDAQTFADVAAVQKPLVETAETKARGLGTMSKDRWETLAKQLLELGLIDKAPNIDEILAEVP